MLIELAIGDAYGAGFEFAEPAFVEANNNLTYVDHTANMLLVKSGHYTDDAQMSLALAEALIEEEPWTPLVLADKFVECFHRDKRRGYNGGFYKFLLRNKTGQEFLDNIRPDSERSGAAMRAGVLGMLPDIKMVKEYNEVQAKLTHNTPAGITSSLTAALMVHFLRKKLGSKKDMGRWLAEQVGVTQIANPWSGHVKALGWHCVHAAITAVAEEDSLSAVLKR
ncbi:MAG: ADP-ribosylglycohydrolase family protein, partial [Minisyncoccia bacterium]